MYTMCILYTTYYTLKILLIKGDHEMVRVRWYPRLADCRLSEQYIYFNTQVYSEGRRRV